jgi:hypothetical protein
MMASRGMGDINPSKMPEGKVKKRRDNTDFTEFASGGSTDKWIGKAIKKPGALRKSLGVKEGQKIPVKKLSAAAKKPGIMGKRARLAETLKGMKK